jgi:hypothetical protein
MGPFDACPECRACPADTCRTRRQQRPGLGRPHRLPRALAARQAAAQRRRPAPTDADTALRLHDPSAAGSPHHRPSNPPAVPGRADEPRRHSRASRERVGAVAVPLPHVQNHRARHPERSSSLRAGGIPGHRLPQGSSRQLLERGGSNSVLGHCGGHDAAPVVVAAAEVDPLRRRPGRGGAEPQHRTSFDYQDGDQQQRGETDPGNTAQSPPCPTDLMASLRRPGDCHRETIRFLTARIILTPRRDVDLPDRDPPHRVVRPSAHKWHSIATPSSRSGTGGRSEMDPSRHPH